jgi:hypothetical protein
MKNLPYYMLLAIAFICFLLYHPNASADTESVWLTSGEWSRHTNQDVHKYRQNNTGVGLQADLSGDTSLMLGWYNNSIHRETVYMGITYTPWHVGGAKFGGVYAMVTGYAKFVPAIPIASLYGSYEYDRVGVNVYWLPSVVVAVQLKVKI